MCENLPGRHVQALLDSIGGARGVNASPVALVLQSCLSANQGGQTATELYEANIMENIREENYVRGYLWTLLNTSHSALTLGAKDIHDQAYIARREGLITSDAYWSTTALAAGRTAALLALTAGTGAAVGGFAEGFALARGAGATTASLLGAGTGGGAAGLAGQFGGDVYDQALLGREGFSSPGEYAAAFGLGAGGGLLTAGVGAASARYLPGGQQMAQRMAEYHSGSPAGEYNFAQGPRQALHRALYNLYRNSSFAGRDFGRTTLPGYEDYFEWVDPQGRRHIFQGEGPGRGGHLWPPNPEGGPAVADPTSRSGPKSSYPRTWNQERIMQAVANAVSDPTHPWYRSGQVGQGPVSNGLPWNWPNLNTRFATNITVDGVTILIISRPTAGGVITAYPIGSTDPANILMSVPPYGALAPNNPDNRTR